MSAKKKTEVKEKPLEKMTAIELREAAKEIEGITGAHGMNKTELISAIKKAKGIEDTKVKASDTSTREKKDKIRQLKVERDKALQSKDKKMATIYKRRIAKLKKKTRRAA